MSGILLDTHIWAWSLHNNLPSSTESIIRSAVAIYVSPITFYEIGQKVHLSKWPEMEPFIDRLPELLADQNGMIAPLTPDICLRAATLDWDHRDPFDRLLAATCLDSGLTLISVDAAFDRLPGLVRKG